MKEDTVSKEALKKRVLDEIEAHRDELIEAGRWLFAHPAPGFRETEAASFMKGKFEALGLSVTDGIAITGLTARLRRPPEESEKCREPHKGSEKPCVPTDEPEKGCSRREGPEKRRTCIGIMGELDSLIMPNHPKADPETGYYHGCGHHAQLTTVLGCAIGLTCSGVAKELSGDVKYICVPAEEAVENEWRYSLVRKGLISSIGGKENFVELGVFDDVDAVLMSHAMGDSPYPYAWCGHSWNGIIHKTIRFTGKSAHAGLAPEKGINALEAALCAMNNINAMRESFADEDHVRIHYIITNGGKSPNVVPDEVVLEMGVRAATMPVLTEVNRRVDKALRLGAEVIGDGCEITDLAPTPPCIQNRPLGELYLENARAILGPDKVENAFGCHRSSSTDCGIVAQIRPTIHPYFGGFVGKPHSADFDIADEYAAYVVPSKIAAATVIDLLSSTVIDLLSSDDVRL